MKNPTSWMPSIAVACCALAAHGCKKDDSSGASTPPTSAGSPAPALPAGLFVNEAPGPTRSVAEVKADSKLAGEVVVQGRIGGRKEPFVEGVAIFLLADASMKSCDELHGDACKTPWDYCCEPRESLKAKTATIQIVGPDGKPLRVGLKGHDRLTPLVKLTIAGEIAQREGGTLVINARKIHVKTSEG